MHIIVCPVLKFPLTTTEYAYNSVPSVGSIKLMTIFVAKMGQNGRKQNAQLFLKLTALSGIKSNFDLNKLLS